MTTKIRVLFLFSMFMASWAIWIVPPLLVGIFSGDPDWHVWFMDYLNYFKLLIHIFDAPVYPTFIILASLFLIRLFWEAPCVITGGMVFMFFTIFLFSPVALVLGTTLITR